MDCMQAMSGMMGWLMGGVGVIAILFAIVLILSAAALLKYLFQGRR
jgi:hypothetical protein